MHKKRTFRLRRRTLSINWKERTNPTVNTMFPQFDDWSRFESVICFGYLLPPYPFVWFHVCGVMPLAITLLVNRRIKCVDKMLHIMLAILDPVSSAQGQEPKLIVYKYQYYGQNSTWIWYFIALRGTTNPYTENPYISKTCFIWWW